MPLFTFLQLTGLSALWGASFLLIRIASPLLGPAVMATMRIAFATLTLTLLMRVLHQRWPWQHARDLLLIAVMAVAAPFLLYGWAALHLPAGYSALLNTMAVPFSCIVGVWMGMDKLNSAKIVGCVLGFIGVALVVRLGPIAPTPSIMLAALACLGAALCYGISNPLMKRAVAHIEPLAIAGGIHLWSLLLLAPVAAVQWPWAQVTPAAIVITMVLGMLTSALAFWLHLRILRHISAIAAMAPTFLIPLFGVAWGHIFLDEPLNPAMAVGAALVLAAAALISEINPFKQKAAVENAKTTNAMRSDLPPS